MCNIERALVAGVRIWDTSYFEDRPAWPFNSFYNFPHRPHIFQCGLLTPSPKTHTGHKWRDQYFKHIAKRPLFGGWKMLYTRVPAVSAVPAWLIVNKCLQLSLRHLHSSKIERIIKTWYLDHCMCVWPFRNNIKGIWTPSQQVHTTCWGTNNVSDLPIWLLPLHDWVDRTARAGYSQYYFSGVFCNKIGACSYFVTFE